MRVLIVNKFYYPRGGDCVVAMNLERLLREQGHEVAVFAMRYPENVASEWSDHFASQVEMAGGAGDKMRAMARILGLGDIKRSFSRVLNEFKPQVVHLHNIHSYLSPVVARLAHERGCRVVWTMHDYKLMCPSYSCLLHGEPCERCIGRGKLPVLTNRCMKGSAAASAVAWLEALRWNRRNLSRWTHAFICPSRFMASKMKKDGFPEEKLRVVCNHIDPAKLALYSNNAPAAGRQDYYAYVGRLSPEKGVETLLAVAAQLPYRLKIAGTGPLHEQLQRQYARCGNIEFLGQLTAQEVAKLLTEARFSVMPSQCYDNNPLGVIESLCAGTPVVGARMGGIPELLGDNSGITFTAGDKDELKSAVTQAFATRWNHSGIAAEACRRFSHEQHLSDILSIYTAKSQ